MKVEIIEEKTSVIEVSDTEITASDAQRVKTVEVGVLGPQGITGEKGDVGDTGPQGLQGPPGVDGINAGASYIHNQLTPASTWLVTHNLGFFPNVSIVDSAGTEVEGEVFYDSINGLTLNFSAPFSGYAYLS